VAKLSCFTVEKVIESPERQCNTNRTSTHSRNIDVVHRTIAVSIRMLLLYDSIYLFQSMLILQFCQLCNDAAMFTISS